MYVYSIYIYIAVGVCMHNIMHIHIDSYIIMHVFLVQNIP